MSDLFRQTVNHPPPPQPSTSSSTARPRPTPISKPGAIPEDDDPEDLSSDSSSADSAASTNTLRPDSHPDLQPAPPSHWTNFFSQELYLDHVDAERGTKARYHVYLTPPADVKKGPLFICHHGAGSSGLSFAVFATEIGKLLPGAGILSLEARGHGSTVTKLPSSSPQRPHPHSETPGTPEETEEEEIDLDYSLPTLTHDATTMITLTLRTQHWPALPPTILLGHSLGGAIATHLAADPAPPLHPHLLGTAVLDVVEGSALEALAHMRTYLAARPQTFPSPAAAIAWHLRTRTIRDVRSAEASVPALLTPVVANRASNSNNPSTGSADPITDPAPTYTWKTDLRTTQPWWPAWFTGMSARFLAGRGAKLLLLAGTDRLDRELLIGQMQGRFQLTVVPDAGHFVQEDAPGRVAEVVAEFWRRNDRGALVLPPKVGELIARGVKV